MKRLFASLAILSMASGASAADPTTEILQAPFIHDYITLSLGPDNGGKTIVKYTIDSNVSPRAAAGKTFRSSDEVAIHIQSFNPLTQVWVVEAKATPDVSYTAIKAFLDDLTALQAALPSVTPAGGAAPNAADPCDRLKQLIADAFRALTAQEITPGELQALVDGAHGHAGVSRAAGDLTAKQVKIRTNTDNARVALAHIRNEFSEFTKLPPPKECSNVTSKILVDYVEVRSTSDRIIAAKEALFTQLGDLQKAVQPYLQQAVWRGPALSDYAIKAIKPSFAEQQNVSVTAKQRAITLNGNSIVITTDDTNVVTGQFTVRKSSVFVAERAVAVIYNDLTYPQYGTATDENGEIVVQRVDDHDPVNGALMLNLVTRFRGLSVAYPLLQLGVSSAKDFPGFLAGVGLRFVEPFNFSLSVGGMITRYKDLDGELEDGDPVSGTAEIEEHLVYKTSPVVLYGAIQVKF